MNSKIWFRLIGFSFLVGTWFLFVITFLQAYTAPDKAITIMIDNYHEAQIEFFLIILSVPFIAYFIKYIFSKMQEDYNKKA